MPLLPITFPYSEFVFDPLHDLNTVAEAASRLVQQYQTPKTKAFVQALAAPCQDLEDALYQLYSQRSLLTAVGASMDVLGRIIGQPRYGFSDDTYRLWLQARVLINRSSGAPEEIYSIFALVLNPGVTQTLWYQAPACFLLTFGGAAVSDTLGRIYASFLRAVRAGGVGGQVVWSQSAPSGTLTLDGTGAKALDNGALAEASN